VTAWPADELEAFADRRLWPCFRCLELFDPREAKICEECKWMVCPRCRACLCFLSGKEKIVTVADFLKLVGELSRRTGAKEREVMTALLRRLEG